MSVRTDYPADADGDALHRVANGGSDMSRPMVVDFMDAVSDPTSAELVAKAAIRVGNYVAAGGP